MAMKKQFIKKWESESSSSQITTATRCTSIEEWLAFKKMTEVLTPGDGHCILHAVEYATGEPSNSIRKSVVEELKNNSFYKGFVLSNVDLPKEIMEWSENKHFDQDSIYLVLGAIANAKAISIVVVEEHQQEVLETYISPAKSHVKPTQKIYLIKRNDHYNFSLQLDAEKSDNEEGDHQFSNDKPFDLIEVTDEDNDDENQGWQTVKGKSKLKSGFAPGFTPLSVNNRFNVLDSSSSSCGDDDNDDIFITGFDQDERMITISSSDNESSNNNSPISKKQKLKSAVPYKAARDINFEDQDFVSAHPSYYNHDPTLPIFSKDRKPVKTQNAARIIMDEQNIEYVATSVPEDICDNVSFLIDTNKIGHWKNALCDSMGSWRACGTPSMALAKTNGQWTLGVNNGPDYPDFIVYRHKYINNSSPDLHRVIIRVTNSTGQLQQNIYVQYYFEYKVHLVQVMAHGNNKSSKHSFHRTQESTNIRIKELQRSGLKPKDTFHTIIEELGGIENVKSKSQLPKNRQQIRNLTRKNEDGDELLCIMDMSKEEAATGDPFVRDVISSPDIIVFLACNRQFEDITKFCTNTNMFCIRGVDTTFNIGKFFVTVTTYRHLMLKTKFDVHPVMIGPVLIHQRQTTQSYHMLSSLAVKHAPSLKNLMAFGTDGEKALSDGLKANFQSARHILCDIHMKDNIISKLSSLGIKGDISKAFIRDIFGYQNGDEKIGGLVDIQMNDKFDKAVDEIRLVWSKRHDKGEDFYSYFLKHKVCSIRNCMSADLRSACGLGYPALAYTQNANEAINSVIKKDCTGRQSITEFVKSLKRLVKRQEEEVKLAIAGRGEYVVDEAYSSFHVGDKYFNMLPLQRKLAHKRFQNAQLVTDSSSLIALSQGRCLSVTPEKSQILTIPHAIIEPMFQKAAKFVNTDKAIVPAPTLGNIEGKSIFFVASETNPNAPHYVTLYPNMKIVCDDKCMKWVTYKACSHTLAVAEKNECLRPFLNWFNNEYRFLNFTALSNIGLPSGRGKKPHKNTQIRKGKANKRKLIPTSFRPSPFVKNTSPQIIESQVNSLPPFPSPPVGSYVLYLLQHCDKRVNKCFGCSCSLKPDGLIPQAPRDLVIVSKARRSYMLNGNERWTNPCNVYFHFNESCVRKQNRFFVSSLIYIPNVIRESFTEEHLGILDELNIT